MTTTINASPSNGLVSTADGSGILKVQSNGKTTNAIAWVNFNGTGTVAIRSSYNVSSITDNGTGNYTLNFTNALSDANYSTFALHSTVAGDVSCTYLVSYTTTTARISTSVWGGPADPATVNVVIFGN